MPFTLSVSLSLQIFRNHSINYDFFGVRLKLLITGSTGLLGSSIRTQCDSLFEVSAPSRIQLDLEDGVAVARYISELQPDYCIHTAAHVYGLGGHRLHPNKALFLNSKIDINLISALSETNIEHFVYVGTVASYGYPYLTQPLVENDFMKGVPHAGEYGYAMAKRFGFDLASSLKLNGTSVTYAIMTNMFGPNDNFNDKTGHVIPSLIARGFTALESGSSLQVWGEETDSRDFLYSEIAAKRIIQALNGRHDGLLNIGSGKERRIIDVAMIIKDYLGLANLEMKHGGVNAIHKRTLNISLLENKFGEIPDEFESNLMKTIDWYRANRAVVRR
jgi:GDP-L-fucose synthase